MDLQQAEDLFEQAKKAYENNEVEKSIGLLRQIEKSSDEIKQIYARAQYILGVLLKTQERR